MAKESRFRRSFNKWHDKRDKTLFRAERQDLYLIYWTLWRTFKFKKCLWVTCKILGLFVTPFTANDKYSLLNRGNFLQHFQMQLSKKRKTLSNFFLYFVKLYSILNIFKKRWPWHLMNIWIYGLRNTSLNKRLKSPTSEDPSTSDMVNEQKHNWNLSRNTFTIFINPFEGHSGWKSLSE